MAVVGPNGAGKSTLVNAIAGLQPRSAGEILVGDTDVSRLAAHRVCAEGVAIVPEGRRVFAQMTVADNLALGAYRPAARREHRTTLSRVQALFPRLAERAGQLAGSLSVGEQQMVAIGRALMARPTLLLLDEPSLWAGPGRRRRGVRRDRGDRRVRGERARGRAGRAAGAGGESAGIPAVRGAGGRRPRTPAELADSAEVRRTVLGLCGAPPPRRGPPAGRAVPAGARRRTCRRTSAGRHGRAVVVDGRAVCAGCGRPAPVGPGAGHGRARTAFLTPVDEASVGLAYPEFGRRHPVAVDPAYGPVTTAEDWAAARDRLAAYWSAGGASYLERVGLLAGRRVPVGGWGLSPGLVQALDLPARRRELVGRFAWAIPGPAALATIAAAGPVVEVGAGTGYWAGLLRDRGADVVATDPAAGGGTAYHPAGPLWTDVEPVDGVAAVRRHQDRTLLLCWPPPEDDAASWSVLRAYRADVLLYVGEGIDGPAGTARFHRELALNWTVTDEVAIPTWPGLRDRLTVFGVTRSAGRTGFGTGARPAAGWSAPGTSAGCDRCVATRPAALTLRSGPHRVEYDEAALAALPAPLRTALLASPNRTSADSALPRRPAAGLRTRAGEARDASSPSAGVRYRRRGPGGGDRGGGHRGTAVVVADRGQRDHRGGVQRTPAPRRSRAGRGAVAASTACPRSRAPSTRSSSRARRSPGASPSSRPTAAGAATQLAPQTARHDQHAPGHRRPRASRVTAAAPAASVPSTDRRCRLNHVSGLRSCAL